MGIWSTQRNGGLARSREEGVDFGKAKKEKREIWPRFGERGWRGSSFLLNKRGDSPKIEWGFSWIGK